MTEFADIDFEKMNAESLAKLLLGVMRMLASTKAEDTNKIIALMEELVSKVDMSPVAYKPVIIGEWVLVSNDLKEWMLGTFTGKADNRYTVGETKNSFLYCRPYPAEFMKLTMIRFNGDDDIQGTYPLDIDHDDQILVLYKNGTYEVGPARGLQWYRDETSDNYHILAFAKLPELIDTLRD